MIDINLIRKDETRELVMKSEEKRFKDPKLVIEIYHLDKLRLKKQNQLETLKMKTNILKKEAAILKKEGKEEEFHKKVEEMKDLKTEMVELEQVVEQNSQIVLEKLKSIGNILEEEVFFSKNEEDSKIVSEYQSQRKQLALLSYDQIFEKVKGVDLERGIKLFGHRGYILKEEIALLKNALTSYAISFARKRGYELIQPPVLMKRNEISKTAQLSDFDEQLYSVEEDLYLIATSEQPISMMYEGERFKPKDLPLKYLGESLCFRKEAGAHGKDNKGIFRVHQFDKIEQFVICAPGESNKIFKEMVKVAEDFYKSLDLSYKVISIVSGEMNDAATIKYDIEVYFPETGRFRELVSCSNCTDYQSRNGEIRYGLSKKDGVKEYVHMLNATLCALQRTLCCLVENYQTPEGIIVPQVLRKYFEDEFIFYK